MNLDLALLHKSAWGPGPWQEEPDRLEFTYKGLPCVILRNSEVTGSLCGYVGVFPDHPWYEAAYSDCVKGCPRVEPKPLEKMGNFPAPELIQKWHMERKRFACQDDYKPDHTPDSIIDVHGGLTHSGSSNKYLFRTQPAPGEPEKIWWFGFDCSHSGDLSPRMDVITKMISPELHRWHNNDVYRDMAYVKAEVQTLAEQLLAVK